MDDPFLSNHDNNLSNYSVNEDEELRQDQVHASTDVDQQIQQLPAKPRASSVDSDEAKAEDKQWRAFEVNKVFNKADKTRRYKNNYISTSKYNCFTFLPKNLFEQFTKMANFYFLCLSVMELFPSISDSGGRPVLLMPLSFVVGVSMIKDLYEDCKRKSQDNKENNCKIQCVPRGKAAMQEMKTSDIQVGTIVKVKASDPFPCDLLLLLSSEANGMCEIQTKNLDGETNSKVKKPDKDVHRLAHNEHDVLTKFNGALIECEQPNEFLYTFNGNLTMPSLNKGAPLPISESSILLRGSSLSETEWVYGIAIYTGHETKIMMNSTGARVKKSDVEKKTDKYIILLVLIQTTICLVAGVIYSLWENLQGDKLIYLNLNTNGESEDVFKVGAQSFGTWFLVMMNFVPISLLVCLEMVKFFQGSFIQMDYRMVCPQKGLNAVVQSSNLNEQLGMVHFIFSDKTGTLTQNVMEFKRFSAGPVSYGKNDPQLIEYPLGVSNVNFEDEAAFQHLENKEAMNHKRIRDLREAIAVNHLVRAKNFEDPDGTPYVAYNATAPDELALVNGARHLGFEFLEEDEGTYVFRIDGQEQKARYKLLNVIEFDSDRKRMTTIVETPTGEILVCCKGADSVVMKLLKENQADEMAKTNAFLDEYSSKGLRTLLYVSKVIPRLEYDEWNYRWAKASLQATGKAKKLAKLGAEIEQEFNLLGSTAIEDKLQEDVGQVIKDLKSAGIQLWVLTGDKPDTAIQIGYACELLTDTIMNLEIKQQRYSKLSEEIHHLIAEQKIKHHLRSAVIVAGDSLSVIQEHHDLTKAFMDLCMGAQVVLACRVSPKQKAQVVRMMRDREPTKATLAIGDGANDVNMITEAHIGIGISGLEGQQAATAADYSIGQFRFLKNLLLTHGREAYRRNTYLVSYMFYKNILYVWPIWFFGFYSYFSGTPIYDILMYQFYNVIFTGLPIIWFAVQDWEVSKQVLLDNPKMYKIGLLDIYFNSYVFWRWFVYGVWQGTLLLILAFYTLQSATTENGQNGSIYLEGQFVFGAVVIIVNLKVLISSSVWDFFAVFFVLGSIVSFFVIFWLMSSIPSYYLYGIYDEILKMPESYLSLFFFAFSFLLIDAGMHSANQEVRNLQLLKLEMIDQNAEERRRAKLDRIPDKSQINHATNRGFAFSSAPGSNDTLINDTLSNRFKDALAKRLFPDINMDKPKAGINGSQRGTEYAQSEEMKSFHEGEYQADQTVQLLDGAMDPTSLAQNNHFGNE